MITRNVIVSLTISLLAIQVAEVNTQSAFPAPLPGRVAANDPAFPPVLGQAGTRNDPAFPLVPGQTGTKSDPAFPPISGQTALRNDPAFPRVGGGASFPAGGTAPILGGGFASGPLAATMQGGGPPAACTKGFMPLREEAEKRGKMIKAASERHARPNEACKLIEQEIEHQAGSARSTPKTACGT